MTQPGQWGFSYISAAIVGKPQGEKAGFLATEFYTRIYLTQESPIEPDNKFNDKFFEFIYFTQLRTRFRKRHGKANPGPWVLSVRKKK